MVEINAEQIQELRQAFDLMDRDADGIINISDLATVMNSLGQPLETNEIENMIKEADTGSKGGIDFLEFLALMSRQMRQSDVESELRESFRVIDREGDGFITPQNLKFILISLGLDSSPQTVRRMISEIDRNRNGKISFSEFKAIALGQ